MRHVGPSSLGYETGTKEWWDCAIRQSYRSARFQLRCARTWADRLREHMAQPPSRRSKRRTAIILLWLIDCLQRAAWWRDSARGTREARNNRHQEFTPS